MSRFVRSQIENISNKMNGGLPRWQSQNIKRIRIPIISDIPTKLKDKLVDAYQSHNITEIDRIVDSILNLKCEKNLVSVKPAIPKSLFDYDFSNTIGSPGFGIQWRISQRRSRSANIGSNTARLGGLKKRGFSLRESSFRLYFTASDTTWCFFFAPYFDDLHLLNSIDISKYAVPKQTVPKWTFRNYLFPSHQSYEILW